MYLARYAYESLILKQSHIQFDGLWEKDNSYYVVCSSLSDDLLTDEGDKFSVEWFDRNCRPVVCPMYLAISAPLGSRFVEPRTADELSQLHGDPMTLGDVYRELFAALPKNFPLFRIKEISQKLIFCVNQALTNEQTNILEITCANLGLRQLIEIVIIDEPLSINNNAVLNRQGRDALALISSRVLPSQLSMNLRRAYEEDEEFWVDNRSKILFDKIEHQKLLLPESFNKKTSTCFIDVTTFPAKNIRTYLTLYRRIILGLPIASHFNEALQTLNITEIELIELARRGRVQFILPVSLERYPTKFISSILDAAPDAVLFSRRLTACSIVDSKNRMPILFPPFSNTDRRSILDLMKPIGEPSIDLFLGTIRQELGKSWIGMELNLSTRGALGLLNHGMPPILAKLYHVLTGIDLTLEIDTAMLRVGWAAALGATFFPIDEDRYSEYPVAAFCAGAFSGINTQNIVNPIINLETIVGGLLTLNNDAPVLEVEGVFLNSDSDRLFELTEKIFNQSIDMEEIEQKILDINDKVTQYEKRTDRQTRLDLITLAGILGGLATKGWYVPLAAWVSKYMLQNADPSRDVGGKTLDWLRAINTMSPRDAVFISRLRKKIN